MTSGMIWAPYDGLNKFYNFYVSAVVGIIRYGLNIDVTKTNLIHLS